jgi:hypothetical protein
MVWLLLLTLSCGYKNLAPGASVEGSPAQLANMRAMVTAEKAYDAEFDEWVACEPTPVPPELVDGTQRAWPRGTAFDQLGWMPDGLVRGSYWVTVSDQGFQVNSVDWYKDARVFCTRAFTNDGGMDPQPSCSIQ